LYQNCIYIIAMDEVDRHIIIENHGGFIRSVDSNAHSPVQERYTSINQLNTSHHISSHLSSPRRPYRTYILQDGLKQREVVYVPFHRILADECGWQIGRNKFLLENEIRNTQLVVTERGFLGKGVVGIVEEVRVPGFEKTFARKRIMLSKGKQASIRDRMEIQSEIENLKSLDHKNIVKILGCYEEQWGRTPTICVLMFPVGDADLGHFLYEQCQPASEQHKLWIRSWFRCLASALAYMHAQGIHHEDIKPANLVHRGDTIIFTDFSSSRRLEAGQDTSTESSAKASRLFAAPEAMSDDGTVLRHGSKSDIFSLGLVYVEMLVVLMGSSVYAMRDFVFKDKMQEKRYCHVIDEILCFVAHGLLPEGLSLYTMLYPTRQFRPSADNIVESLENGEQWSEESDQYESEEDDIDGEKDDSCLVISESTADDDYVLLGK
jgi:serine/threonine protein kinase